MATKSKKQGASRTTWIVAGVVIGVVAIAGIVAVASNKGGGSSSATGQTQSVQVVGTALPTYDQAASPDPAVGLTAPTLKGSSFDGTPITIAPGGTPRLVVFVAHWCPHCQREVPVLVDWLKSGVKPANLQVSLVSTSVTADRPNYPPSQWLQQVGWPGVVLADDAQGTAGEAYGLSSFPYMVLTGTDGKVLLRMSGEITVADLEKAIQAAIPAT